MQQDADLDPFVLGSPFPTSAASCSSSSKKREVIVPSFPVDTHISVQRSSSPLMIAQRTRAKATVEDSILEESVEVINEVEEYFEKNVQQPFLLTLSGSQNILNPERIPAVSQSRCDGGRWEPR